MGMRWHRGGSVELPTTTIYFTEAMASEIGPSGSASHPIWRLSPNAFLIRETDDPQLFIIRHLDEPAAAVLRQLRSMRVHYLLDDDIWAGMCDTNLPLAYRKRLFSLARSIRPVLKRAEHIYVTSEALQARFGQRGRIVSPCLVQPVKHLEHHASGRLRIVFPGTRARLQDLASIAAPLARFLREHPDCELHTFLGDYAPGELRLANIVHHKPQSWSAYTNTLQREQFHIGIVPALPTRFNAARSHNKILELASYGAAPVYGSGLPFRHMAAEAGAAILCNNSGDWYDLLSSLNQDRHLVQRVAANNSRLALRLGLPEALRRFWQNEFGILPATEKVAA